MDLSDLAGFVDINDDDQPAPENEPGNNYVTDVVYENWGHSGICFC